ncbi:MAG: hypothetical protein ABF294_08220, partial [Flavobacteriales bacterium]
MLAGFLSACGGSSSSDESSASVSTATSTIQISGDLSPSVGQSVALIATVSDKNTDVATIKWTQTIGASLELVAINSAVLAFDIPESGTYGFNVDVTA